MKKIGFVGAYDKTDMILYTGKVLSALRQKVLIIDSTLTQKAKYVVPVINPTISYVTDFEDMDIAVGFNSFDEIKKYLGLTREQELDYDFIMIDVDNLESFEKFGLKDADRNFFVTSFDLYSLKKGLEILQGLREVTSLTKVIFSKEIFKEDDDYLNFLSTGYKIAWNEYRIYFPMENGDLTVIAENQRVAKVRFRKLSTSYKEGLTFLSQEVAKDISESQIRRVIKNIEKGA